MSIITPLKADDEIISSIYHGLLESNPWKPFITCLRKRLDCDVAAITLRPAKAGVKALTVWDRSSPLSDSDVTVAMEEQARLAHLDPLTKALGQSGDIYTLDDVMSRAEFNQSEFYLKVLKPSGVEYMLGMYISEPNGWKCHVGIMNGPNRNNFGETEKLYLSSLCSHLEYALQVHSLLNRNLLEKEIYEEALNRLTIGSIILDGRGKIIEINQVAKNILRLNSYISQIDSSITFSKSKYRTEFNNLIKQAVAWREKGNADSFVDALRIEGPTGSNVGLLIRSAPVSQWYQNDASPSVIVYLGDLEQQHSPSEQFVARLFGLTPSEAVLATLLANGLTIMEAATKLNLTESSARTYSKKIFAKTGTSRQAELVRLILKSVALLAGTSSPPNRLQNPR